MDEDERKEYRGILVDVEESPYFKAIGERKKKMVTMEQAYEKKWELERKILELTQEFERESGLKIDGISFLRNEDELLATALVRVLL